MPNSLRRVLAAAAIGHRAPSSTMPRRDQGAVRHIATAPAPFRRARADSGLGGAGFRSGSGTATARLRAAGRRAKGRRAVGESRAPARAARRGRRRGQDAWRIRGTGPGSAKGRFRAEGPSIQTLLREFEFKLRIFLRELEFMLLVSVSFHGPARKAGSAPKTRAVSRICACLRTWRGDLDRGGRPRRGGWAVAAGRRLAKARGVRVRPARGLLGACDRPPRPGPPPRRGR